jgi:hypothetical protein
MSWLASRASGEITLVETPQIPNSFLTSLMNRQSVPFAMIVSGDDLIMPISRSRSAQKRTESSTS